MDGRRGGERIRRQGADAAVLLFEFLRTSVLWVVILNVAVPRRAAGNGYNGTVWSAP